MKNITHVEHRITLSKHSTCSQLHSHALLSIVDTIILHRYFKPSINLQTPSQAQLLTNVLGEVNQAVTTVLQRAVRPSEARSKSTLSFLLRLRIELYPSIAIGGVAFPLLANTIILFAKASFAIVKIHSQNPTYGVAN